MARRSTSTDKRSASAGQKAEKRALKSLDDKELFALVGEGDEAAFNVLYERYFSLIYAFVFARVRNHADAEDLTQETFVSVFRSADRYSGRSAPLAWVYGIAKNTVYNRLRRQKRRDDRLDKVGIDPLSPILGRAAEDPESQLAYRRYFSAMDDRLQSLRPWQAEVFLLRYVENLPIREIAKRMDRSNDAIRSSLYRVKRLLADASDPRDARANV